MGRDLFKAIYLKELEPLSPLIPNYISPTSFLLCFPSHKGFCLLQLFNLSFYHQIDNQSPPSGIPITTAHSNFNQSEIRSQDSYPETISLISFREKQKSLSLLPSFCFSYIPEIQTSRRLLSELKRGLPFSLFSWKKDIDCWEKKKKQTKPLPTSLDTQIQFNYWPLSIFFL